MELPSEVYKAYNTSVILGQTDRMVHSQSVVCLLPLSVCVQVVLGVLEGIPITQSYR